MDSYKLREELNNLNKEIAAAKHIKEVMEDRVNKLHEEELRYLEEIPIFKSNANIEKNKCEEQIERSDLLRKDLNELNDNLKRIKSLILDSSDLLTKKKDELNKIENDSELLKLDIARRQADFKTRELNLQNREKSCDSKELSLIDREARLDKLEFELNNRQSLIDEAGKKIHDSLNEYASKLLVYEKNIKLLSENKKLHSYDEELLRDKIQKADKLIKENSDIKASLLLQADKISKELAVTKKKQESLERNIADLINQENILKIKDLKIKKMAHDAGLQKELKELEDSLR